MAKQTYETTGTLRDPTAGEDERADLLPPGTEVELTDAEAEPLLDREAIQEPGAGEAPAPAGPAEVQLETHPLTAETIAEIEVLVPAIDDVERLEAALEEEDTKGGQEAIEARIDELEDEE